MSESKPYISSVDKSKKREIAEQAKKLTEGFSTPPIPALEIAENNGIDVIFRGFGAHTKRVAGFVDFDHSRMFINDELDVMETSFTIAHELGHWMMHKDLFHENPSKYAIMPRFATPDLTSKYEVEANIFAEHLLIPTELLKEVISAPPATLKKLFMVSLSQMESRLRDVKGK